MPALGVQGTTALETSTTSEPRRIARRARFVTYGLLIAVLVVGVTESEVWPLSAFRLFSGVRSGESIKWELATVDSGGTEHAIDLSGLPRSFGRVQHLLPELDGRPRAEQEAVIDSWLRAVDLDPGDFVAARVYSVEERVPTDAGEPAQVMYRSVVTAVDLS